MAYVPQSGSVVAFQGNPSVLQALVTVQALQGHSISGTVVANPIGSVITVSQSSVAVAIVSGSIAASFTPPANQSVSGTVQTAQSGTVITSLVGVSAFPSADSAAIQNNLPVAAFPVVFNGVNWDRLRGNSSIGALVSTASSSVITMVQSSVATVIIGGSIAASFTPPANQSVSGTVTANQGTNPWIITGSVQTSGGTTGNSSVQLLGGSAVIGSVTVLQGTNPFIIFGSVQTVGGNSSVQVLNTVTVQQSGTYITSVVNSIPSSLLAGYYVQRNDSVSSFLGGNLTWNPASSDSAGRTLIKPFAANESALDTSTSIVSTSVTALFASAVGLRNYVTDVIISNTGAATTLITFKDGSTSILGYTIAPAGGGSNINGMLFPFKSAPGQDFVFQVGTATSILYITAKGFQAP